MAEPTLGPAELSDLEDALESLEFGQLPAHPCALVRERMTAYRELLVASRDALPLEDVPLGALSSVLAAARSSAEVDVLGVGDGAHEDALRAKAPSLWERLRRGFMLPSLAVAGSAALVLLIVKPSAPDELVIASAPSSQVGARTEAAPSQVEAARPNRSVSPAAPAGLNLGEDRAPEEDPEPAVDAERPPNAATVAGKAGGALQSALDEGEVVELATATRPGAPNPGPARQDTDKAASAGWDAISRGDSARRAGDCIGARTQYDSALDDANDGIRARALAGLGLCAATSGDVISAGDYYRKAETLDLEVSAYISTQEHPSNAVDAGRATKKKRKRKKRNSKSKSPLFDQAL